MVHQIHLWVVLIPLHRHLLHWIHSITVKNPYLYFLLLCCLLFLNLHIFKKEIQRNPIEYHKVNRRVIWDMCWILSPVKCIQWLCIFSRFSAMSYDKFTDTRLIFFQKGYSYFVLSFAFSTCFSEIITLNWFITTIL